jgi:hypothetical protein
MHLFNRILTATTFAFMTVLLLLFVLLPDQEFSAAENRMLQQMPSFSWDNLLSGKFSLAAEKYLSDQFPFRDTWVGIKSAAELLRQKRDNNGVYFGKGGYLLQKPQQLNMAILAENIAAVNRFAEALSAEVFFLPAPSSVQILQERLPPFAQPRQAGELQKIIAEQLAAHIQLIDTGSALAAHREEYIYYKTDHHWTSLGAYYAYREAANFLGYTALNLDDITIEQVSDNFYGTLHAKSGHRFIQPDAIQIFKPKKELVCRVAYVYDNRSADSLYAREQLRNKDQYAIFLGGNHALVCITTQNETGRKLLIVKDSYANSLVPFLVNHYAEIHMIDLRHFNFELISYIEQYGFKEILLLYNTISFAEDPSIRKIGVSNCFPL